MAFSEKIKREVREKSNYQCILCGEKIVEVHHIQPQSQGGEDTFENAAALCSQCHTLYGNNPKMKEEILRKRDIAYQKYEEIQKKIEEHKFIRMKKAEGMAKIPVQEKTSLIRCYISEKENFNQAAQKIFNAIVSEEKENPNKKRELVVEIEGHRNKEGGYDRDMFELQYEFLLKSLLPYLYKLHMPLVSVENPKEQEKIPAGFLKICDTKEEWKQLKEEKEYFALNEMEEEDGGK